jgi:hypothetical protein
MHTGPEDSLYLYIVHKRARASTLPEILVCSINLDSQEQGVARIPTPRHVFSWLPQLIGKVSIDKRLR